MRRRLSKHATRRSAMIKTMPHSAHDSAIRSTIGSDREFVHAAQQAHVRRLVRAICIADGRVLLAQAQGRAHHSLPGGGINNHEEPSCALRREMREELGVEIAISPLLGTFPHTWFLEALPIAELQYLFAAGVPACTRRVPQSCEPRLSFSWHSIDSLCAIDVRPDWIVAQIERVALDLPHQLGAALS